MTQQPVRKQVLVDVNEFVRTRDALGSAYLGLSASLDKAVKAYLDHTDVVLAGDATLNVSYLTQPFVHLAQTAQQALSGLAVVGDANAALTELDAKRRKRAYRKRDPNAPKRPQTAYFRFLNQNRADFVNELAQSSTNGTQKPGDVTKLATEKWHKLTTEEQQPYREAYQVELRDYEDAVSRYKASLAPGELLPENLLSTVVAAATPAPLAAGAGSDSSDSSSDDSSDSDDEPPPPPPKTPTGKAGRASKKATTEAAAPASSPERKRRAAAPASDVPDSKRTKAAAKAEPPASETKDKKRKKRKSTTKADA